MESGLVVSKWIFTIVATPILVLAISATFSKKISLTMTIALWCTFLWALGKALAFWVVGPVLIRWYMADVVFVPAFVLGAALFMSGPTVLWYTETNIVRRALGAGWCLGMLIELIEQHLEDIAYLNNKPAPMYLRGDWNDAIIFTVIASVCFGLTFLTKKEALP